LPNRRSLLLDSVHLHKGGMGMLKFGKTLGVGTRRCAG
jgi:hypothetical protein